MTDSSTDNDNLMRLAAEGDSLAADELIQTHRDRLRRMVDVRMDPLLRARIDPSDIVQDTLLEASEKLPRYLRERPLPLYPWLRQIAWEHLIRMREQHVLAEKRSVRREVPQPNPLPDESTMHLARQLFGEISSPSQKAVRNEMRDRVSKVLNDMEPHDREVLLMWYLEQLSVIDIAAILELTPSGVKSRHRRALHRLIQLLPGPQGEQ